MFLLTMSIFSLFCMIRSEDDIFFRSIKQLEIRKAKTKRKKMEESPASPGVGFAQLPERPIQDYEYDMMFDCVVNREDRVVGVDGPEITAESFQFGEMGVVAPVYYGRDKTIALTQLKRSIKIENVQIWQMDAATRDYIVPVALMKFNADGRLEFSVEAARAHAHRFRTPAEVRIVYYYCLSNGKQHHARIVFYIPYYETP